MRLYRPTTLDTNRHTQASLLMIMLQRSASFIMPALSVRNLVMRWRGGSTKSYQTAVRQLSKELSTLNPGSSPTNRSTQERSMRSTTLMSVTVMTSKRSRSVSRMSGTQTVKVRIMILTTKTTNVTILTTAPATHLVLDTSLTITTMEGTSTTTRATSQRNQQMFK